MVSTVAKDLHPRFTLRVWPILPTSIQIVYLASTLGPFVKQSIILMLFKKTLDDFSDIHNQTLEWNVIVERIIRSSPFLLLLGAQKEVVVGVLLLFLEGILENQDLRPA
jgi:hypothetical protein